MFALFRHMGRLLWVAKTLSRHGALDVLADVPRLAWVPKLTGVIWRPRPEQDRPGQRLALALTELGPSFIKLGQALSIRSDLLGEQMAEDLSELQDRLPPFPADDAIATIEAELEAPLAALFSQFDGEAVAAASIAQVHFATTVDGDEVAVKVLRPGVRAAFAKDLELFSWLARLVERLSPAARRLKPIEVIATLAQSVRLEMDLRFEAAACSEMRSNFEGDPSFAIPQVDWARTAESVLTLERVSGHRVDSPAEVEALGLDPEVIVTAAAQAFFNMVFRDGFFHADMHPGNLFVTDDGVLVAVDFGITGRLGFTTRQYLAEMLMGFLEGDYHRVAQVHIDAGYVPAHQSVDDFALAARSIAEPILGKPIEEISIARLLAQLFKITEDFEMQTQPQLLMLQKSMLLAEGVGRALAPGINMWDLARPMVEDWMRDSLGPEARVMHAGQEATSTLSAVPRIVKRLDEISADAVAHGLKLHPETLAAMETRREKSPLRWLPWGLVAVLAVALVFG